MINPTLDYRRSQTTRAKPLRYSELTGWAWAMCIVEAAYRGSVIGYAFSRTNIYVWERFERNVGPMKVYLELDLLFMAIGATFAFSSLLVPNTKRWAAAWALAGHVVLLVLNGGRYVLYRP